MNFRCHFKYDFQKEIGTTYSEIDTAIGTQNSIVLRIYGVFQFMPEIEYNQQAQHTQPNIRTEIKKNVDIQILIETIIYSCR